MSFLHGVEVIELNGGTRPVSTPKSSVIGLIGTAASGPINTPVLLTGSRKQAEAIFGKPGDLHTIPQAIDAIFDQSPALIVAINIGSPYVDEIRTNTESTEAKAFVNNMLPLDVSGRVIDGLPKNAITNLTVSSANGQTNYINGSDFIGVVPGKTIAAKDVAANMEFEVAAGEIEIVVVNVKSTESSKDTSLTDGIEYDLELTEATKDNKGSIKLSGIDINKVKGKVTVEYRRLAKDFAHVTVLPESNLALALANVPEGETLKFVVNYDYTKSNATHKGTINNFDKQQAAVENAAATHLIASQSVVEVTPRLLLAPGYTHKKTVVDSLIGAAERLRAIVIADGPNDKNIDAQKYAKKLGSPRVYLVDPSVKVNNEIQVASPRVAGVIVKSDNERGFWYSPSNRVILGITGTKRPIDFTLGDRLAAANILNEGKVATIISQSGYRLWGNRSTSADPKWAFISIRRTADMINDALLKSHMWAVDQNLTKSYVTSVTAGVNNYLNHLKAIGAILGGNCWADAALNTPDQITQGKITFDFDFTPPYPAEHITFRSKLVDNYISEVI